ncbi:MAG: ribulose-phosphate 3-epimerase [Gaiellaceae bacterium]|jgi:ribulose-phosphate 3-epimerase
MPWSDWVRTAEIEPSIYAADFSCLGEQIEMLLRGGVRIFQFDVGDGQFVTPITTGPIVLKSIAPVVHAGGGVVDCHLMIVEPQKHFAAFAQAGGDSVTVHYEVVGGRLLDVVAQAREHGLEVGLALNPETRVAKAATAAISAGVDLVLCMSINPGYSGQEFMPEALGRIRELRELLPAQMHIQVDGGIGSDNIRKVYEAGANLFVADSSIFGREDIVRAYRRLVSALA